MKFNIDFRALIILSLFFIAFTVIGTISHEFGHIAVAKYLGYETLLHYGSMNYDAIDQLDYHDLLIAIGGPLQTLLTGTLGLLILLYRRNSISKKGMKFIDWFAVFLSLFWLREVFNLMMSIAREIISPDGTWFSGDELYISQSLNLYDGAFAILLAIVGLMNSIYVIFQVLPSRIRSTFILSGFIGGLSGFILWFYFIGPMVLP